MHAPLILDALRDLYAHKETEIEEWFGAAREVAEPFITSSVDLRHSGLRLVPVDTNLFPAGFNNLSENGIKRAVKFFARWLAEKKPDAKSVLLVAESHTRNLGYLENLYVLSTILAHTGLEVRIGNVSIGAADTQTLTTLSGKEITQVGMKKEGDKVVCAGGFVPDVMVLNNDCTSGIPEQLQGKTQPICPPPRVGWFQRRKSEHFKHYATLAETFGRDFGLDSWLLAAHFRVCENLDFKAQAGLDPLAKAVDDIISAAKQKHAEYGIAEDPYVFVKADSGTYGMGIMTVRDGSEMLELNKKERNKMHVIKEGAEVNSVIVQEGVPTIDTIKDAVAEPMIYLVDGLPVGGMYRVNANRDRYSNLNASGVEFTGMCDELEATFDCREPVKDCHFRSFGLVAALAALAAAREQY